MASLKNMSSVAMLNEQLKTQHHLMKVTFLVLQSFQQITDAAEYACTLTCYLCNKCFNDKFQVTTAVLAITVHVVYLAVILIWRFGKFLLVHQI